MKKKFTVAWLFVFLFASCSDFLDEQNETRYSAEYIYSTPEGLKLATNALYALQRYYANDTENATIFALERATDLAVTNGGTGNFFGTYDPNFLKPSASQVGFMWSTMYQIIGKANEIINASKEMEDSPSLRETVAEARCFRAQSYFLLYRTFDRIWLNTTPTTPENVNDPREYYAASQKDVFDLIYSDLNYAIENLSWTSSEPGRFNQAAARHMKAKAAMWIKDWTTALNEAEQIDKSGKFHLVNAENVFNAADLNHEESLLVQQWSKNPGGNLSEATPKGNYFAAYFIAQYRTEIGGTAEYACSYENWGYTYGRCLPSPYLFSLYDKAKDKRYTTYYVHQYKNTTNSPIAYGSVNVAPGSYFPLYKSGKINRNVYPGCVKYGDIWTRTPSETRGYKDVILYRLAETYIIGAEAALMKGDQALAKYYYNKTWERAGNDKFTGVLTLKDVIDEQARELAFEGDRWYFLKRLGILIEQVRNYAGDPEISASIAGRTNLPANPHFVRWPIPEAEVINMGAENFPQNAGYN
ncbi:putative outer membrane starch-binding protein [Arcticibacter tournemirensis]|uniref:RagB/SusD family nutrient uptake outer membrane protein n=1 Tax=Arcticibacter tournemirensis TaxID=699437 RepID=A0A5M9HDL6_9SPHI|nr:RagB/SusD family nutrient uptake outer membrane protein [Arcticibacter tournemirensis]KAA8485052.1 RagB/SusD family nutrient uptake outer membrane protein [Arcticibacter tournemirensis]TQM50492.1 putative outer membrane starch-binding protein [Arcticibacter tournemirensis]